MSNNYTQLCTDLKPATTDARTWLLEQYEILLKIQDELEKMEEREDLPFDPDADLLAEAMKSTSAVLDPLLAACVHKWDISVWGGLPGFELSSQGSVLLADDGGEVIVDRVADFIQAFLTRHNPKGAHSFEYAFTGDGGRPDDFGGGACFITADEIKWNSTNHWLSRQWASFEALKSGTPGLGVYELSVEGLVLTDTLREYIASHAESLTGVTCYVRPGVTVEPRDDPNKEEETTNDE